MFDVFCAEIFAVVSFSPESRIQFEGGESVMPENIQYPLNLKGKGKLLSTEATKYQTMQIASFLP
jgi:hypothetical protein